MGSQQPKILKLKQGWSPNAGDHILNRDSDSWWLYYAFCKQHNKGRKKLEKWYGDGYHRGVYRHLGSVNLSRIIFNKISIVIQRRLGYD